MATNLPSCFSIQFLEQLLKFLVNFTLLKYVKSQRSYGFLITKELIFGFQILDLKDHFSVSLKKLAPLKLERSYYLTGALWHVSSKVIQFAKSAILSAHSPCRAKRGGVRLAVLCPCLRCAVRHCQIQNNLAQVQLAERQIALLGFIGLPY